jgi:RNA polymerase sigma-70 factor (ECF subfamily)
MPDRGIQPVAERSAELATLLDELYQKSRGAEFGLTVEAFEQIVQEVIAKYLPANVPRAGIHDFCASLRVEELALARACAAGHDRAWEFFLTRYREKLYNIAGYIAKESSAGRELADSIYADLYGTTTREGKRNSKLASYTGRGSLEGWLRTVMAQEFVNRYRRQRRTVSLDEESEEGAQFAAADREPAIAVDPRVESATDEALAELSSEDKFVLASYFLDSRTLAEIARSLRVHESTISRKVDKLAKSLRKRILTGLARRGMSRRQAEEALQVDVRDLRVNLRSRLVQESASPAFSEKKAGGSG